MTSPATSSPFNFHDYRIVIAGGSKGIGRSMALAFAASGAAISICARGQAALDETAEAIAAHGAPVHTQSCDLGDAAAITSYIENAARALGGIDVLINNASGYGFEDKEEDWVAGFNIDMMAPVRASHAALPHLSKSAHASILHTSSIAGLYPRPNTPPYGAMKAALCHYTTSQAPGARATAHPRQRHRTRLHRVRRRLVGSLQARRSGALRHRAVENSVRPLRHAG